MASIQPKLFARKVEYPMQASFPAIQPFKMESLRLSLHIDGLLLAVPTMPQAFNESPSPIVDGDLPEACGFFPPALKLSSSDYSLSVCLLNQLEESCNIKSAGYQISKCVKPQFVPYAAVKGNTGQLELLKAMERSSRIHTGRATFLEPPIMKRKSMVSQQDICHMITDYLYLLS